MRVVRSHIPMLTLAMVVAATSRAPAQNVLGDGRRLDANLQVGTYGRNAPAVRNTYGDVGNAITTGNVSGLGSFRGRLGYTPGNEFHGRLGTSDLFDFRRRARSDFHTGVTDLSTHYGNTFRRNYRDYAGIDANNPYSTGAIRAAEAPTLTAGQLTGQSQPYNVSPQSLRAGTSALQATRADVRLDARTDLALPAYSTQRLGVGRGADGRMMELAASPLTGLSMRDFRRPSLDRPQASVEMGAAGADIQPVDDETETPDLGEYQGIAGRLGGLVRAPSWALGEPLSGRIDPDDPRLRQALAQRAEAIEKQLFRPLGSASAAPGEDVYLDLLRDIRNAAGPTAGPVAGDRLTGESPEAMPRSFDEQVQRNIERYAEARRQTEQERAERQQTEAAATQAEQAGEDETAEPTAGSDAYRRVMGELDYDLPEITSLAGANENALSQAMARGDRLMQQGRYFDAEDAYRAALSHRREYPLARAGQANAQLGAGLFASSGRTLYGLFSEHPELIKARYAPPIIPDAERAAHLDRSLRRMMDRHQTPELPLALAYLGYQQQRPAVVREGLNLFEQRAPDDRLLPLLRRLWLDQSDPPKP